MNIKITGKDLKATDAIKEYIEKKTSKLGKFLSGDMNISVTITSENNYQTAEMQISHMQDIYRATAKDKDLYASIDKDIDIIEGQIRKTKAKKDKKTKDLSIKGIVLGESKEETQEENEVLKTKHYDLKPISIDDAKLELKSKPKKQFLTFINIDTEKVNVLYRLKDGKNYGVVEPEI